MTPAELAAAWFDAERARLAAEAALVDHDDRREAIRLAVTAAALNARTAADALGYACFPDDAPPDPKSYFVCVSGGAIVTARDNQTQNNRFDVRLARPAPAERT
jgi:hypothetical protein